tara:strand:+ start:5162 stop:5767 length:606 start_codon:yes stop_codon:yes gene_type:complete
VVYISQDTVKMINTIFSINIYKEKLAIKNKPLIDYVLNLQKQTGGRKISNPTGWQSLNFDLSQDIFLNLNEEIHKHFLSYIKNIPLNNKFKISSMWANVNEYKDYNLIHTHGDSVISGVYYLKNPKNSGNLFFANPASEGIEYLWENCIEEYTQQNSACWTIAVEEGDLVLFPSWLKHGVEPNLNKKENRISIAFNININA